MGCYAYSLRVEYPPDFSDQQEEDRESVLAAQGLDPFSCWTFRYATSKSDPPYTEKEALTLAAETATSIADLYTDLKVYVRRIGFCMCCPDEIFEEWLITPPA